MSDFAYIRAERLDAAGVREHRTRNRGDEQNERGIESSSAASRTLGSISSEVPQQTSTERDRQTCTARGRTGGLPGQLVALDRHEQDDGDE